MVFVAEEGVLDEDTYYFECCAGLGDTLLTCGYLDALQEKYQAPIRLLVKPSHAFIPEMYDIKGSWVIGQTISAASVKKNTKSKPAKGRVYAAHPCKHPELWNFFKPVYEYTSTIRFLTWFKRFLGIEERSKLQNPWKYPELSKAAEDECARFAPLDRIAVLSPEAVSVPALPWYFWRELADELRRKGLFVISNVIDPQNTVFGTAYVKMSSADAVSLCMRCHSVYSIRSGLCDLIAKKGANLHVYYPSHSAFFLYELEQMFPEIGVREHIILPG